MSFPSRLGIPILVTSATLIVCSLGMRAELRMSQASIAAHRLQTQHGQQTARSIEAMRQEEGTNPPRF
jgi:hypothetical protein